MKAGLTLTPGRKGTKRLTDNYGDRLVCVRYRYDEATGHRCTTVELIESEEPWLPAKRTVQVKIRYDEIPLLVEVMRGDDLDETGTCRDTSTGLSTSLWRGGRVTRRSTPTCQ